MPTVDATPCYIFNAGSIIQAENNLPCGVTNRTHKSVACCLREDQCLSNGICYYTHSLEGGSGYYAGGCTDANFDGCPKRCGTVLIVID